MQPRTRIAKINNKFYDLGTPNKSFLKVAKELKLLGIKNCYFMLEIYDYSLVNVDPHQCDSKGNCTLTKDQVSRIALECMKNPWYFLREVVRIPEPGGSPVMYKANRGNIAQAWCMWKGLDSWLCLPRQQGKTISSIAFHTWVYLFGTNASTFIYINKDSDQAKTNLKRMSNIIHLLPEYMQAGYAIDDEGKKTKAKDTATALGNPINDNQVIVKPKATSYETALSIARGLTAPILYFDEPEFTNYIKTIVENSVSTFETAARIAKSNCAMYYRCFTCTPGDLDTKTGAQAQMLLDKTATWTEKIYDYETSAIGLEKSMENFFLAKGEDCNKILYIQYSYKQIGLTENWLKDISAKIGDYLTVRREILLQRLHGSSLSPYPQEDIEFICDSEQKPIDELWINDYYCFMIYENLNKGIPYIVGVDCSTGTNKDNNAITILNPYTCKPVAEFECSYIGETAYEKLLITLVTEIIPRGVLVIERNSVGDGIIDHLLNSKVANRLYFDKTMDLLKDKMEANETWKSVLQKEANKKSYYGVFTGKTSRETMFSILARHVNEKKENFVTHNIIRDLSRLVMTPSGKIVAGTGVDADGEEFHDDSIMSYLIALYVYYHGNNLEIFGITKYDPTLTPSEEKKKTIRDVNQNLINQKALEEVKTQVERAKKSAQYTEWEKIMKEAAAKSQAERYLLHKKGLIHDELFEHSQSDVYGADDSGSIPMSFFKTINNM